MNQPVLTAQDITKKFGATTALDRVSLEIRAHEVVGLVGENGSGKSTLLKILAAVHRPDSGTLVLRGQPARFNSIADATAAGIGAVYQEQSLVPNITVAENILLGNEGRAVRGGWYNWREMRRQAATALRQLDLDIDPGARTRELSFAQRQMVEIAKVLFLERRANHEPVILLDEPTSVLENKEIRTLFAQIRRLREAGSVIFVSHRLNEVLEISDRIYVFKNGNCVGERDPKTCRTEELYEMMVGRSASGSYYREQDQEMFDAGRVVLSLRGLSSKGRYSEVDLDVHAGEVLALTGLIGSGCESVCRTVFGAEPFGRGVMRLNGKPVAPMSPADAVRMGIGYVPAERRVEGVVMGMDVASNMILVAPRAISRGPFIDFRRWHSVVREWIERLSIRAGSARAGIATLSGGNQQKVVLAKWLLQPHLKLLLLDHPARGLDVGAKEEVYQLIRQLAKRGIAIVLLADSVDEAIGLSHTVVVMRDGGISGHFAATTAAKPAEAEVVRCMT